VRQVLRCLPVARRLHHERTLTTVISTGSGVALGFLPYLAARGVRAHYIESASRMGRPSLTGQLLSAVPGIRLYTQYEWNAKGRWKYGGSVFDSFERTEHAEPAPVRRAVVVLGTMYEKYQFRRLLDALVPLLGCDGALERAQGSPVDTLWQSGSTFTDGLAIDARPWVPSAELDAAIAKADLVVSHAGVGAALTTLSAGRLPVVIARDPSRGEIDDAHQQRFARELDARGLALSREPETLSVDDLVAAARYRVVRPAIPPFRLRA
jgi:hypothetical protein